MNSANSIISKSRVALITGATGFVGGHLARRLVRDGWQVHVLTRFGSRLPEGAEFGNVTSHVHDGSTRSMVACVAEAKPDIVFHLASLFLSQHETKDVESLIQSNVLFGSQLLEAMKVNGVSNIINTGTSWQHYNNEDFNPVCLYAATKQAFEAILDFYVQAGWVRAITLKLFDTYGPIDPRPKLFHLLEKAARSGEPLNMSAGEQMIDIVHIDDVVDAFLIAALRLLEANEFQHERYAISSGNPIALKDLVHLYSKILGRVVSVNWGAKPYRFREVMNTWSRGTQLTGWNPQINLEHGLRSLLKASNLSRIQL